MVRTVETRSVPRSAETRARASRGHGYSSDRDRAKFGARRDRSDVIIATVFDQWRPWSLVIVALVVVLLFGVTAFVIRTASTEEGGRYATAYAGLCQSHESAVAGEIDDAARLFHDTAHEPLHELSAEAEQRDRSAAARLLEAKAKVEAAFERDDKGVARQLAALLRVASEAITVAGEETPDPCPTEEAS